MSSSSRWTLLVISALTLLSTGCRRPGDDAACTDREVRQCARAHERDAVEIVFAREDYTCSEAVNDGSCGIDAEALRRCVDALPTPLCVGAPYQHVNARTLFETTACAEALDTYLECRDDDSRYSSPRSRHSSHDDWYDD